MLQLKYGIYQSPYLQRTVQFWIASNEQVVLLSLRFCHQLYKEKEKAWYAIQGTERAFLDLEKLMTKIYIDLAAFTLSN